MLDWLLAPVDATRVHDVGFYLSWHARLMVVAWGVLAPLGVIVARYFKIMPKQRWPEEVDNRIWWNTHRICQYTAACLTVVALLLIQNIVEVTWSTGLHYLFGWSVIGFGLLQILGGLMRGTKGGPTEPAPDGSWRGDHYDMSQRRIVFEHIHKTLGYVTLLLAAVAIVTGLWQANAARWMFVALTIWWSALLVISATFQKKGMCIDTYQALWGPDGRHPGNARKAPIGFKVRRIEPEAGE